MRNIILLGAPGCGKGSQGAMLSSKFGYLKVSTGDLLRKMATENTELGQNIADIIAKGILVPNEIVDQLIDDFYNKNLSASGIIFDGYPRTVEQAKSLELILAKRNRQIDKVFYFDVSEEVVVKRITGRYTCVDCGEIYNRFFHNTHIIDQCDKCSSKNFNTRNDDKIEIIIERLKIFKSSIKDLLEYYENKLIKLDANTEINEVFYQILENL